MRAQVGIGQMNGQPFQLVFEGIVGKSYLGDIAIDDVSLKTGTCSQGAGANYQLIKYLYSFESFKEGFF